MSMNDRTAYWLDTARVGDEYEIAEVTAEAWRDAYRHILPAEFLADLDLNRWAERVRRCRADGIPTFVAGQGERILGTVFVTTCDETGYEEMAELKALYVRPEAQGKGLGRALVHCCTRQAIDLGYDAMCCCAFTENLSARAFYLALEAELGSQIVCRVAGKDYWDQVYIWRDLSALMGRLGEVASQFNAYRPRPNCGLRRLD
ncbi:MAG: hypothetical protein HONBIEJF_00270 [Fimbriimonadaceae bacterium]|nr:hypothetical protein [Fimbriimonadaceae bacterium]